MTANMFKTLVTFKDNKNNIEDGMNDDPLNRAIDLGLV
jgi:hypothetical protein